MKTKEEVKAALIEVGNLWARLKYEIALREGVRQKVMAGANEDVKVIFIELAEAKKQANQKEELLVFGQPVSLVDTQALRYRLQTAIGQIEILEWVLNDSETSSMMETIRKTNQYF